MGPYYRKLLSAILLGEKIYQYYPWLEDLINSFVFLFESLNFFCSFDKGGSSKKQQRKYHY